jgi:hypothetical protein
VATIVDQARAVQGDEEADLGAAADDGGDDTDVAGPDDVNEDTLRAYITELNDDEHEITKRKHFAGRFNLNKCAFMLLVNITSVLCLVIFGFGVILVINFTSNLTDERSH